jgi:hypothetical protein
MTTYNKFAVRVLMFVTVGMLTVAAIVSQIPPARKGGGAVRIQDETLVAFRDTASRMLADVAHDTTGGDIEAVQQRAAVMERLLMQPHIQQTATNELFDTLAVDWSSIYSSDYGALRQFRARGCVVAVPRDADLAHTRALYAWAVIVVPLRARAQTSSM